MLRCSSRLIISSCLPAQPLLHCMHHWSQLCRCYANDICRSHLMAVSSTCIISRPPAYHLLCPQYFGVDVNTGGVVNTFDAFVWEPALVKLNAVQVRPPPHQTMLIVGVLCCSRT